MFKINIKSTFILFSPVHPAIYNSKLAGPENLVREYLISLADLSLAALLLLLGHLDADRLSLLDGRHSRRLLLADGRLGAGLHHRGHGGPDGGLELCYGHFI